MPRPALPVDVDATASVAVWRGEQLRTVTLPRGARLAFPPEPFVVLADARTAIERALATPLDGPPLAQLLRANMKLTVALDDKITSLIPHRTPDARQLAIEAVLELAAAVGIDDVELLVARGINRRLTNTELYELLGERIHDSFIHNGWFSHHDAADTAQLVSIGRTKTGDDVSINRRIAESDLVVYVGIGGVTPAARLTSFASDELARRIRTAPTGDHISQEAFDLVNSSIQFFNVQTTVDGRVFPPPLGFLDQRQHRPSTPTRIQLKAFTAASRLMPAAAMRQLFRRLSTPEALTSVAAGPFTAVSDAVNRQQHDQNHVAVDTPVDIVSVGVKPVSPLAANSVINPLIALHDALTQARPLVRDGGVVLIHHSLTAEFNTVHHPSHGDFFNQVLTKTRDSKEIEADFEPKFANDTWYTQLYRNAYAFHGSHPIALWRECSQIMQHLGGVIAVGGEPSSADRLGIRATSNFDDALALSRDLLQKPDPDLVHVC